MNKRIEYHKVTKELLEVLKTHVTIGSLRRDCSMATQMIEQPAESTCPRLFYALINNVWEVHAIELDLLRYLLYVDTLTPHPEPTPDIDKKFFIPSEFKWDGIIGKSKDHDWSDPVSESAGKYGHHLIFDGYIERYSADEYHREGNFIGTIANVDVYMLAHYPNATVTFWDTRITRKLSEVNCNGSITWIPQIMVPGQESRMTIQWDDELTESFLVMVTQNSKLI